VTDTICIAYLRVSTAGQVAEGDGLGVQRERIEAWCKFAGLPTIEVFQDAGISGASTENRPAFRHAIRRALELGDRGCLVAYKLDRLGRSALDVQETLGLLLHAGVRVVSVVDGIDSSSGMGSVLLKLLTSILASFAELEKETIRTRLLDGRRRADAHDRTYASEPRYGRHVADADRGLLATDDDEVRAIERMKELRGKGLSYRAIARAVTVEGFRPRRAAAWSDVVVRTILTGKRSQRRSAGTARFERARAALLAEPDAGEVPTPRRVRLAA
jgi:DNA invertase Pin-like site-specific DNA recombinase